MGAAGQGTDPVSEAVSPVDGLSVTDFAVGVEQLAGRCGVEDDVQTGAFGSVLGPVAPAGTVPSNPDVAPMVHASTAASPTRRRGAEEGARVPLATVRCLPGRSLLMDSPLCSPRPRTNTRPGDARRTEPSDRE